MTKQAAAPTSRTSSAGEDYEIRVAGHLDGHWSAAFDGLTLARCDDGTTILSGPVADQAHLHGVLGRVRDLGVTLLSLRTGHCTGAGPARSVRPALTHPLRTDRLTLRPATAADADQTWPYRRLESVGEWLTALTGDPDEYRAVFEDLHRLAATVVVERAGEVVGDLMLRVEDAWAQTEVADRARGAQAELGWVLDPAHTGRGYATEAVRVLLTYCFGELDVRRVVASCFVGNIASRRLMERLGMRREGYAVADSLHRSGQWLDTATYAVLASEWPS